MINYKKILGILLIIILFLCLTLIYLFPIIQGLILLPLDLLVSNYSPWLMSGQILLKNSYMQDSIVQLYPWRHLVFQSLQDGIIPFWNPYQHLGMPFMASLKPMVFYPFNVLFILGELKAWNILLFSQIFLSMIFSYMLARDFKLGFLPSMLMSIAFALNSLMIGVLEFGSEGHVLLWVPLFFLFVRRYIEKEKGKYLFFLGITLSFSILAGQLQYLGYVMIVLISFILFYGYMLKAKIRIYFILLLSIIFGVGLSSFQLIPSIELFSQSHRGLLDHNQVREVFTRGLIHPYHLLRLFSPDFFGNPVTRDLTIGYIETSGYFGIIPLFFCFFVLLFGRRHILARFFMVTFIVTLFLSLRGVGEILYLFKIPVLTSGSADRIFFLAIFSGSILSGFGLSEFLKTKHIKRNILSLCVFTCIFILIVSISAIVNYQLTGSAKAFLHNLRFASLIFGVFFIGTLIYTYLFLKTKSKHLGILFMLFVVGLTFFDLFRLGYRFLTFSNEKFFYPEMGVTKFIEKTSRNTLARNFGLTEPELATYLNVFAVETYNPLYSYRTGILLQALQNKQEEKLSVDNKYFLTSKADVLKRTIDFLGVSLIAVRKDENPSIKYFESNKFQDSFRLVYSDEQHTVYQNLTAFPRFSLYYDAEIVKSDKEILRLIAGDAIDFRKKLILEKTLPLVLDQGTGSARLLVSTVNTQRFEVKTDKPALFYISDTYFPGWIAKVNNIPTDIYRANYNLRAIIVPAGESTIDFSYMSNNFAISVGLTMLSFIMLFVMSFFNKKISSVFTYFLRRNRSKSL